MTKIALYFDGNYFYKVSDYYKEKRGVRPNIKYLKNYIKAFVEKKVAQGDVTSIVDARYFRGRLTYKAIERDPRKTEILENDRRFDDVLHIEGILPHYLPVMILDNGERKEVGIDVYLSLEAYENCSKSRYDVFVLFSGDGDYTPLIKKINALGIYTVVVGVNDPYKDIKISTSLLNEAMSSIVLNEEEGNRDRLESFDFIFSQRQNQRYHQDPLADLHGQEREFAFPSVKTGTVSKVFEGICPSGFIALDNRAGHAFFNCHSFVDSDMADSIRAGDRVEILRYDINPDQSKKDVPYAADIVIIKG